VSPVDALVVVVRLLLAAVFALAAVAKLADRGGLRRTLTAFGVPAARSSARQSADGAATALSTP